eukprot:Gb_31766 [translate_table: standard]
MKEADKAALREAYDYIIVGGGTAGCPLAATLSQNFSVLLLERGGSPYGNINITKMENFHLTLADVSPSSPSQAFVSEDGVINSRARVLGGGSAINAGFYTRANPKYVESVGWNGEVVNQSYRWVEKLVAHRPAMKPWQSALRDALLDVGVSPYNGFTYDHVFGTKEGGTIFNENGERNTAADLLHYANPLKLTVLLHATVHRLLFTKGSTYFNRNCLEISGTFQGVLFAEWVTVEWLVESSNSCCVKDILFLRNTRLVGHGVMYRDARGRKHYAYLKDSRSEIIISAGALGSPQLLMVSGIGPAEHLKSMGIPVLMDQPAVGQGMADNPMNSIFIPTPYPAEKSLLQVVGITKFGSYIEASSGFGTTTDSIHKKYGIMSPKISAQSATTHPKAKDGVVVQKPTKTAIVKESFCGGFILEKIMGPLSRGHLVLNNTNIEDNPSVTFNYFQHPRDLKRCVNGIKTIEKVIKSKHFVSFVNPNMSMTQLRNMSIHVDVNLIPKHSNDTTSLEQFCKDSINTIWHYHGGCQMGRVVDKDYRVFGVDYLRIIDGSTFNFSPGTNPQATVMMMGRYMGVRILRERLGAAARVYHSRLIVLFAKYIVLRFAHVMIDLAGIE